MTTVSPERTGLPKHRRAPFSLVARRRGAGSERISSRRSEARFFTMRTFSRLVVPRLASHRGSQSVRRSDTLVEPACAPAPASTDQPLLERIPHEVGANRQAQLLLD